MTSYVAEANTGADQFVTTLPVTKPAGVASGDVGVFWLTRWEAAGSFPAVTPPSGAVLRGTITNNDEQSLLYLVRLASETSFGFSWTGQRWTAVSAEFFTGVDPALDLSTVPFQSATGTGTAVGTVSVTTVDGAALSYHVSTIATSGSTHSTPTGYTEVADVSPWATSYRIASGGGSQSAAGVVISPTGPWVAGLVALAPAAGGGAPDGYTSRRLRMSWGEWSPWRGAGDDIAPAGGGSRTASDTAAAADAVGRTLTLPRAASDAAAASDTAARADTYPRTVADTAAASDTLTRAAVHPRAAADTAPASDSVASSTTGGAARSVADTAPASDTVTRTVAHPRSLADAAAAADTLTRTAAHPRTVADLAAAGDTAARTATHPRTVADTAAAADSVTKVLIRGRTVADQAPATDTLVRALHSFRIAADTAAAADTVAAALAGVLSRGSAAAGLAAAPVAGAGVQTAPGASAGQAAVSTVSAALGTAAGAGAGTAAAPTAGAGSD